MSGGEITWIVIGAISAIIGVIWGIIRYILGRRLMRKEKEHEKLKVHFEDLKNEVINPIVSFANRLSGGYGCLGSSLSFGDIVQFDPLSSENLKDFEKSESFESFRVHFPSITSEWEHLKEEGIIHNSDRQCFMKEIADSIAECVSPLCLPFKNFATMGSIEASIRDDISECLWKYALYPLVKGFFSMDLNKLEIEAINRFWQLKYGNTTFALTTTSQEAEHLKRCFIQLVEASEYRRRGKELADNAERLLREFKEFGFKLSQCSKNIEDYGIGKEFKPCKSCPICQKF